MVAHVGNCRMIKQFLIMQLTISRDRLTVNRIMKYEVDIYYDLEGYFELYNSLCERMPCCLS